MALGTARIRGGAHRSAGPEPGTERLVRIVAEAQGPVLLTANALTPAIASIKGLAVLHWHAPSRAAMRAAMAAPQP